MDLEEGVLRPGLPSLSNLGSNTAVGAAVLQGSEGQGLNGLERGVLSED